MVKLFKHYFIKKLKMAINKLYSKDIKANFLKVKNQVKENIKMINLFMRVNF